MIKEKDRRSSDQQPETRPDRDPKTKPLLINETEAAELLGFSPRTLQTWRVRGGGPTFVHVSDRCVRYRRKDLEAWITERLRISTSDYGSERE